MVQQSQQFEDEPEPTSHEADTATTDFELHFQALLADMSRITFNILVWGPGIRSTSAVAEKRREIHRRLKAEQHHCWFSEEFTLPPGISLKAYELAQAKAADMIVMLVEATAPGVIGEMHDFCSHRELLPKILLFYPEDMLSSYSGHGLVKDLDKGYRNVEYYKEIDISSCRVRTIVLEWVQARRSYVYSNTSV